MVMDSCRNKKLFIVTVSEPEVEGWIVIDSIGKYGSCGGVRLYPDVSLDEVSALAKAMTLKYSFHNIPLGGAKAAIKIGFDVPIEQKKAKLRLFGKCISPLIWNKIYTPWTDMNSSDEDIAEIYAGAGVKYHSRPGDPSYFTALSTFSAVCAYAEFYNIQPAECSITIEGLGNVGKYLASELAEKKFKLIGASTRLGAALNTKGLDINEVLQSTARFGDEWVLQKGNWENCDVKALFSAPMDIHIPCARAFSIDEEVADQLKCKAVISVANCPYTKQGMQRLLSKKIIVMPDFVTNSGGVTGPGLINLGGTNESVRDIFLDNFKNMFNRMLGLAERMKTTPVEVALKVCSENCENIWQSAIPKVSLTKKITRGIIRRIKKTFHLRHLDFCTQSNKIKQGIDNLFRT